MICFNLCCACMITDTKPGSGLREQQFSWGHHVRASNSYAKLTSFRDPIVILFEGIDLFTVVFESEQSKEQRQQPLSLPPVSKFNLTSKQVLSSCERVGRVEQVLVTGPRLQDLTFGCGAEMLFHSRILFCALVARVVFMCMGFETN